MRFRSPLFFLFLCMVGNSFAHSKEIDSVQFETILLEPIAFDAPFNTGENHSWPSMNQSLSLTASVFELSGYGIDKITTKIESPAGKMASRIGLETALLGAMFYLPGGTTWLHEEFHRAVLNTSGIESYNSMYDFNIDITSVSVNHVSDSALINLKSVHAEESVRLAEAGHEGQIVLVDHLLENSFFTKGKNLLIPAWFELIENTGYMFYCLSEASDKEIVEFNHLETEPDFRDIVGWDYTAWVYDLHRPNEPYGARGTHLTGTGVDRYVRFEQLSDVEKQYLTGQSWLSLVNLVRPQLYGFNQFNGSLGGKPWRIMGSLEHHLTSFGNQISARVLAERDKVQFTGRVSINSSDHLHLPELAVGIRDVHVGSEHSPFYWSPSIAVGFQPDELRFDSRSAQFGVYTHQKVELTRTKQWGIFAQLEAKNSGWQAGVVDLRKGISGSLGLIWRGKS